MIPNNKMVNYIVFIVSIIKTIVLINLMVTSFLMRIFKPIFFIELYILIVVIINIFITLEKIKIF